MPLYLVSSAQYVGDTAATTFTPDSVPAHVTGDVILYIVSADLSPASALTATAGWTVQDSGANSDTVRTAFVYKTAASSGETAPTFTSPVTSFWGVTCDIIRGAHATPIDSFAFNNAIAAGLDHASPALTTTNNGCGLLYAFCSDCAANGRAYLSPNDLVPGQLLAPATTFLLMTGTRRQETAGSVPSVTARQEQSNGGQSLVIAIRSADGVNHMQDPTGGVEIIRDFTQYNGLTTEPPSNIAATVGGITARPTASTGAEGSELTAKTWGRPLQWTGSANANSGVWEGPTFTGLSLNLSNSLIALTVQLNAVTTVRLGAEGVILVLYTSAGNWTAYTVRTRAQMRASVPYTKILNPATADIFASSGTLNLANVTGFGIWARRSPTSNTTANVLQTAHFVKLTTAKLIGGGTNNPLSFADLAAQVPAFYGMTQWTSAIGPFVELAQPVEIGNNSISTYFDNSNGALQFPAKKVSYDAGEGVTPLTIKTSATGSLGLNSSLLIANIQQPLTIDASAANPGFLTSGLSVVGMLPTLKTGFNFSSVVFDTCGEIDAKGTTLTSCNILSGTNTGGAAMKLDAGASLASCSFVKGAETYALRIPAAGTYSLNGTTFSGYTTVINVTAASGTVTINLATGQAQPTFITAGATVVFALPAIYFRGPSYANGTRYQLTHEQVFQIVSADINTSTEQITLGLDDNGDAAALDISTSGYHSLVKIDLATGATMPTTVPQIINGGRYRVKTNSAGVITLSVVEGGATITFTNAGANNGGGQLFTATAETDLARGLVSGGAGLSVAAVLPDGARIRRRAIHYEEISGETVTSNFYDDIFLWSTAGDTTDSAEINNAINPWIVPNQIATLSSILLKNSVTDSAGNEFTSVTPADAGSAVAGLTLSLEGSGKIQLNSSDSDGLVVGYDLALWLPYQASTAAGIWIFEKSTIVTIDLFNFSVSGLEVDETSGTFTKFVGPLIDGIGVAASTTGSVALNVGTNGTGAITSLPAPTALEVADAVWDEVLTGATHNIATSAGRRLRQLGTPLAAEGALTGTPTTTSLPTDLTQAVNNFYNDQTLRMTSGALTGQAVPISAYNGTTKTITLSEALTSAPTAGDTFEIESNHIHSIAQIQNGLALQSDLLITKNIIEADEVHTPTQIKKLLKGTATELLVKDFTGTPLSSFQAVE